MLNWKLWQGEAASWNKLLMEFPDYNIYQSHGWGEHKAHFGWIPFRLTAGNGRETVSAAQVLVRRFPLGVALAWTNGGPVGSVDAWGEPFRAAIRQAIRARHLYCRINPFREHSDRESRLVGASGWSRPSRPLLSGQSTVLELGSNEDEWLKSMNSKHRYYVKKSNGAAISWTHGNSESLRRDFVGLTQELSAEKGMNLQERDVHTIEDLNKSIPDAIYIVMGYIDAKPITGCLTLVQGNRALYASAATVAKGRELSAAYSMLARLRSMLRERKISQLDFGGINPKSEKARGVDHFKRGFGGREIRFLGEWDWASTALLRRAANYLIWRRTGGM